MEDLNYEVVERQGARHTVIKVIGAGGGGTNAVNCMIESGLSGIEFIAANTDLQALDGSCAPKKLTIGSRTTQGLGAGGKPEVGMKAAEDDKDMIADALKGADMVFVTAGMGGGTGTGAAPVIAQTARELGALTVGVVTKPFGFEGKYKMGLAQEGIERLHQSVDSLIVIENEKILSVADKEMTAMDAFKLADETLFQGIAGISSLILEQGVINLDFADVKSTMYEQGDAIMGIGVAEGKDRAREAARLAMENPLLEDTNIDGATRMLIAVFGGDDLLMSEIDEANNTIRAKADPDVEIIPGLYRLPKFENKIQVILIATGFKKRDAGAKDEAEDSGADVMGTDEFDGYLTGQRKKQAGLGPRKIGFGETAPASPAGKSFYDPKDLEVPAYWRYKEAQGL